MTIQRLTFLILAIVAIACPAATFGAPGAKGADQERFYQSLGDFFKLPDSVVTAIRDRRIADEDLAPLFTLAKQAGVQPDAVADLRLLRKSWMELTSHFGLTAEIYYIQLDSQPMPPFTRAWSLFKNTQRMLWKKIVLDDNDVVNYSNLRFIAVGYRIPAPEVVKLRSQGRSYVAIASEISTPEFRARLNTGDKKVRSHLREPIKKK